MNAHRPRPSNRVVLRRLATLALALPLAGCAVPREPAVLPPSGEGYVAVLSGEMPGALSQVARHAWIVAQVPGERSLRRFELQHSGSGAFGYFGNGEVAVHAVFRYPKKELLEVVACLERAEHGYHREHPTYIPIPGPNSNTIVDHMLRECDLRVELPATAIGRDYRGAVGASVTSLGTGVQLETWPLGFKLGLEEGIEAHLLGMTLGLHFWPPGITVPVNPGRIGIDDSTHQDPEPRPPRSERERERKHGLGSLFMFTRYARLLDPELASGVSDRATVGFSARGGYGKRVGLGFGFDLDAGVAVPLGFAYEARLFPAGAVLMLGDNTFFGLFGGVGSNGVPHAVTPRLELPAELRLELDLGRSVRAGARALVGWYPGSRLRGGRSWATPFADELLLSAFLRLGTAPPCSCTGRMGRGYFLSLERGEIQKSGFVGASFGIEADFGG